MPDFTVPPSPADQGAGNLLASLLNFDERVQAYLDTLTLEVTEDSTATPDLTVAHNGQHLRLTHATPVLTIEDQTTIAYEANHTTKVVGENEFDIVSVAGVTINGVDASTWTVAVLPGSATLVRVAEDTWELDGTATDTTV